MTKAILIDDEKNSLINLRWKIENFAKNIEVVSTFNKPLEGLAYLENNSIDLLFLDIEMPKMNGFELLKELQPINFDVIFTTAYDEFGIKAIKYSALDYLLKPVQEEELVAAIKKHQEKKRPGLMPSQLDILLQSMNHQNIEQRRIALSTHESIELVYPKDIIYCKAENNYTMVFLPDNRKKLISKTLKDFEEILSDFEFFRIHQSFLVNPQQMSQYMRKDGGYVVMNNDAKIPVSRSKKEELMKYF